MKKALTVALGLMILAGLYLFAMPQVSQSAPPLARPTATPAPPPPGTVTGNSGTGPQLLCPSCPDLIVQSITTEPAMPTVGMTATIKVVIANIGAFNVPTGNNFSVDLYIRPPERPTGFVPGDFFWLAQSWYVPAGSTFEFTTQHQFTDTNTYALYAQVDTGQNVIEANELNNVLGPVAITVRSSGIFVQSTHRDFQYGYASGLDLSNPDGVVTLGEFAEPWQDVGVGPTSVYTPDVRVNDVTASYSGGTLLPTTVEQVRPSLAAGPGDNVYTVWQDARYGGTYNNRIFFARSTNQGATWSASLSLTADIAYTQTVNQLAPRLVYEPTSDQLSVVWQDNRRGHYDIYFSSSTDGGVTWTPSVRVNNDDPPNPDANKMRPSLVAAAGGLIYVVWQDQRNGNDDIYLTRSQDSGATWWSVNTYVTDDPETTGQFHTSPSVGIGCMGYCGDFGTLTEPWIYVAWEDWRDPLHPEIYVADSRDNGLTFGVDVPVEYPAGQSYRIAPTMAVITATSQFTKEVDAGKMVVSATVRTVIVAWQEGKDENADVYYAYSWFSYDHLALDNRVCPDLWAKHFCFEPKVKLNGYHIDYSFAQPPEPKETWVEEPTWQGDVSIFPAVSLVTCDGVTYHEGVYVAWSDGRSFDRDRRDIYVARIAHPHWPNEEITREVHVCRNNAVVNDNAKLYAYRDNPSMWAITKPANVIQSNPSIAAGPLGQVYVAWDDNRFDTPLTPGTRRNRDIFFTRSEPQPYGVYISPVFDTLSALTSWYSMDWFGTTGHGTPIYFQTRTGQTPNPPKANAATGTWSQWAGTLPANMYDAPGQPIVSPPGRYIQYKLIIDGTAPDAHPFETAVTRVTIRYQNQLVPVVFLPIALNGVTGTGLGR